MRYLQRFIQVSFKEKMFFIEALSLLFFSKFLISIFPFRKCIKKFKNSEQLSKEGNPITIRNVRIAIYRANKVAFWKNRCLVSSFAAKIMLQRRGIASILCLGARFEEKRKMEAHAWTMVNEIAVTPKEEYFYKELYHF